jgi:outer membrane protein TolC
MDKYFVFAKVILILFCFSGSGNAVFSQPVKSISLDSCLISAVSSHKLSGQHPILLQNLQAEENVLATESKPLISWSSEASIQTHSIGLPFEIPMTPTADVPLYKIHSGLLGEYTIYDGGIVEARTAMTRAGYLAEQQSLAVEIDKVKQEVVNVFYQILALKNRRSILETTIQDLGLRKEVLNNRVANGVALEIEVEKIEVEILNLKSNILEADAALAGSYSVLTDVTGTHIGEQTLLSTNTPGKIDFGRTSQRKEMYLFELQKSQLETNAVMLDLAYKPKISAFAQAGLGYPNPLNFFDDQLTPYGVGGIRMRWNIVDWGRTREEKSLMVGKKALIDVQKMAFEEALARIASATSARVEKMEDLLDQDQQRILLQEKILSTMGAQLEQGIITSNDYLVQLHALTKSQLERARHTLQIEKLKTEWLVINGNL